MKFENNKIYYLFNSGNNYRTVFFSQRNKTYFRRKINTFIKPFAEVMYVYLPNNQFHILIKTKKNVNIKLLNRNIGIMLSSYVQGVNKELKRMGSLFRQGTKAFAKLSDFPYFIRRKLQQMAVFKDPSRIVLFGKTCMRLLEVLGRNEMILNTSITAKNYTADVRNQQMHYPKNRNTS